LALDGDVDEMESNVLGGRYRLERELSATPMAEVWLARDEQLERQVVVKLLAMDADRQRFEREARAVAGLAHPNIVQVFDYGEDLGRPYMVLEHVPAGTLAERLRDSQRLPDDVTRRIATDVASGLAYAHGNGVVHRDLKPANILFDGEGRAKIADFGIAHVHGTDTLTEDGTVLGTAAYMSPEQVRGEGATAASDVYAFGILLYRMLAGRLPFESEQPLELAAMQRDLDPPPLRSLRPDAPPDLAALATRALAKSPAARPADGAALLAALDESARTLGGAAEAPTTPIAVLRRRRPWPLIAAVAVVLAALGVGLAILLVGTRSSSPAVKTTRRRTHTRPPTTHAASTTTPSTSTSTPSTTTSRTTVPTTTAPVPSTTAPAVTTVTTLSTPIPLPTTVVTTTLP
jgi:serine/threonine-protein kinase